MFLGVFAPGTAIVKLRNSQVFPSVPGEPVPGELWGEDSCRLEGLLGLVGAGAGFEELLALWICLWCEPQGYIYSK